MDQIVVPHNSVAWQQVIAISVSICCATTAVALRLLARKIHKTKMWWDDAFIAMGLFFYLVMSGVGYAITRNALGRHVETLTEAQIVRYLKLLYTVSFLYPIVVTLVKISILCFYYRIFATRTFRRATQVVGAVCVAWGVSVALAGIFQCTPIHKVWEPEIPGKCISTIGYFYGQQIPNILVDLVILVMPLSMLRGLQIPKSQKLMLSVIFLLGAGTVIMACVRLWAMVDLSEPDITYNINAAVFTGVEPGTAIICACLPAMRPLIYASQRFGSKLTSRQSSKDSKGSAISSSKRPFERLHEGPKAALGPNTSSTACVTETTAERVGTSHSEDYPMDSIKVKQDLEWNEEEADAWRGQKPMEVRQDI